MLNPPIFISFYTGFSYYKNAADDLINRITSFGGRIEVEKVNDSGKYWKNTLIKPQFILDKLNFYKEDLIWIDIDTDFLEYPDCMKKWESDILAASHTGDISGIKASPLGVRYNPRSLSFFERFSEVCNRKIETNEIDMDHDVFKFEILPEFTGKISIEILSCGGIPSDYTDGKFIKNGISREINKGDQVRYVMNKNIGRDSSFKSLNLQNFTANGKL